MLALLVVTTIRMLQLEQRDNNPMYIKLYQRGTLYFTLVLGMLSSSSNKSTFDTVP
jgi:hypothetical protein